MYRHVLFEASIFIYLESENSRCLIKYEILAIFWAYLKIIDTEIFAAWAFYEIFGGVDGTIGKFIT